MGETIAHQPGDAGHRFAGDQLVTELAGHRDRDIDGFGFHAVWTPAKRLAMPWMRDADSLQRHRDAAIAFRLGPRAGRRP